MRISIVIDTGDGGPTVSVDDGGTGSGPQEGESSRPKGDRDYPGSSDGGAAPQVPGGFAEPATFTSPPPPAPILGKAGVDATVVGYAGSGDASGGFGEDAAISAGAAPIAAAEEEQTQVAEQDTATAGDDGDSGGAASGRKASPAKTASAKRTSSTAKRGSRFKG